MSEVICGNAIDIIPSLGKFDFIFVDPPFNIGHDYVGFTDKKSETDFEQFIFELVQKCWDACDGVLCLHGNDSLCEIFLRAAKLYQLPKIVWINWFYNFGQCSRYNWIDSRCHCLIFARNGYTWNPESVLVESARVKYGDKRINETENGGLRLPPTVWGVNEPYMGRVQGNNKERRPNHPNQLPELYLARLIKAYTNIGDKILDPCGGSGTTIIVSEKLNRDCITIDISPQNCSSIEERRKIGAIRC